MFLSKSKAGIFVIDLESSYYLLKSWHLRKLLNLKNYAGKIQNKVWVHCSFYFLLECCWDYLRQYWGLTWPFRKAFIFSHIWDHCLSSLFAKFGNWKTACFQNEKCCFQGQILQEVEIRSWSNSVCRSRVISFRWLFSTSIW